MGGFIWCDATGLIRVCVPVVVEILCEESSCNGQGLVNVVFSDHPVEVHGDLLVVVALTHDLRSVLK